MEARMELLYQDNRIVVCRKPAGAVSVDEPGGVPDLVREALGDPAACVRTVHRLDQVVGGAMVLARSREAARRLSAQVADHTFQKTYLAVVCGGPAEDRGTLRDLLGYDKQQRRAYVAAQPGKEVREAVLDYRVLERRGDLTLLEITLRTGRTHQIRTQLSHRGWPIWGDKKYGAPPQPGIGIALWSYRLAFRHPQTDDWVTFSAPPPAAEPWTAFAKAAQA
jgi:23S rRNA pseudouridine1911/1915/1917 synthase